MDSEKCKMASCLPLILENTEKLPKNGAAHKMTRRIPVVHNHTSIEEIRLLIQEHIRSFDTIHYIYIINHSNTLTGVLSIKDIFRHEPSTPAGAACEAKQIISAMPDTPQERVVYLALKHNIKAVPVINKKNELVGALPSDTILKILYQETREDVLRKAGVHSGHDLFDNVLVIPVWKSLRHRVPWLLVGLGGGLLLAKIIGSFEATLEKNIILASFIPLIVYMSDAVRTQTEAFIIRDLAVEAKLPIKKYFSRQFTIVLIMSVVFGGLTLAAAAILYHDVLVALVLGIALVAAIASSITTGLLIPYLFSRLKYDPANTSGPVATVLQDIISIVIYFGVAGFLLR